MKVASTLGTGNQTTIPTAVVEALGLSPSAELIFHIEDGGTVTLTAKTETFESLAGSFPKKTRGKTVSNEEMDEAVRAGAAAAFRRSLS